MKKIIIAISLVFGILILSSCTAQDEIVKIILNSPEKIIYEEEGFNYNSEELTYFTVRSSGTVEENVFQGSVVDLEPEKTSGILSFGVAINSEFHTYEIYVRPKESENLNDEIVMVSFQFNIENIVLNIGATPNTEGIKARVVRANASEPETIQGEEIQELFTAQFKGGEPYQPLTDNGFFQNDSFNMVFKYENFQSEYEVYVAGGEKPITTEDAGFFDWILIIPVAFLTQFFASIFSNSFVVGILITTIIVRTLAWPIYAKSNDMSLKMNLAQPEIQRVQNKYATRKDPQSQQQMQAEMVQLYKKYGIGLGGCLMPFLQMPIFIAMFNVVRRITLEGGMYTSQVSNTYLFGIDLAANNEWYIAGVLSAMVGATMFVLQSLAQKKPSYAKKTGTQNLQAQQSQKTMKYVMYFMIFMMMSISYQSQALAIYFAVEKLKIQKEKIKITIIKEKKGLFSSGKGLYEAKPNINLPLEGKKYLEEILSELNLEYKMEMLTREDGKSIEYKVQTNENARAIGKDGRTLLSIQTVLRNYMSTFTQEKIRVSLDIGEYYSKHRKHLEILATKSAKKVAQSGQEIRLKPMNAYDRRIIHEKLSEWRDVETLSEGESPRRFVIIKTKEK